MPKAAPINADLIRALFTYDPDTGELIPKPTAPLVARRTDANQWEIGRHRYSLHRLVWAYHHPDNANPQYIVCKDGWRNNSRIDNLEAKDVHPRWEGHVKQVKARLSVDGHIILAGDRGARAAATANLKPVPLSKTDNMQALVRHAPKAPNTANTRPEVDTSWVDAFDAE
jgi:hypothetical protein